MPNLHIVKTFYIFVGENPVIHLEQLMPSS